MFEQSLYEQNAADQPLQEGDLFRDYEIKNWEFSPRIYKILGISAFVNILAILIVGQTSLLTMKGCDSPLVNSVCQVLDTVYVGNMLFGTDREYVDTVYEKTDLGDAEITFVDVGGANAPLNYPEGYFQIANPVEFAMRQQQANDPTMNSEFPGIPIGIPTYRPQTGSSLLDTTPNIPKLKSDVVDGQLPEINDSGVGLTSPMNRRRKGLGGGKVTNVPERNPDGSIPGIPNSVAKTDGTKTEPDKKVDPTDPVDPDAINNRPLADLGNYVNDLIDKNQLKLDSQFTVNAKGKLNKDGKFDKTTFKFIKAESSDKTMIDVVRQAIEAINDSGRLKLLEKLTGKDLNVIVSQDNANITALIESELESDTRAVSIKSSLDLAIALAKQSKSGAEADQNDKDDLLLLESAKIETNGKKVIIKFFAPKELLLPMIQRKLAEQKAQPKQQTGNGTLKPNDNSANK